MKNHLPQQYRHNYSYRSWFGNSFHYSPDEALPLTYAMACVEAVAMHSPKASIIFCEIIDGWNRPGIQALFDEINDEFSDPDIIQEFREFEAGIERDIRQPLIDIMATVRQPEWWKPLVDYKPETESSNPEKQEMAEDYGYVYAKILEFIIYGFNRELDLKLGKYKVVPTDNPPWLILAIMFRTLIENARITLENMKQRYKVVMVGGKKIDYEAILTGPPTNRLHRRMVAHARSERQRLKHDEKFADRAMLWYQCRVRYSSIERYCDAQSKKGEILDPKNVLKEIKHCDKAIGYRGRVKRMEAD